MKIVNIEGYTVNPGDLNWEEFYNLGDFTVYDRTNPNEIIDRAKDAEIIISNKSLFTKEVLDSLPNLKFIALQSTGYNVIDIETCKEKGIVVSNIPSYSTEAVAQQTFALLLEIMNAVQIHSDSVHNLEWSNCPDFCYWKTPLSEVYNKNFGIIGYGSIGKKVAQIANAFGMNVMVYTPHPGKDSESIKFVDKNTLFKDSDIISCHCPLTDDTYHIIDKNALKTMKNSAILINTSRGPVVDELALSDALNNGDIYSAGLDVLNTEPPSKDSPILSAKNCYITPHVAWAGKETRARLMSILYNNVKAFISGSPINTVE